MRFLYQPIILPRTVAMGFLSPRSESLVLCGRTEAASTIIVVFGENPGCFDAAASRLRQNRRSELLLPTESLLSDPSDGLITDGF
jgi:hypothetical protein